jgi:methyl-accepting chemotaxis protein
MRNLFVSLKIRIFMLTFLTVASAGLIAAIGGYFLDDALFGQRMGSIRFMTEGAASIAKGFYEQYRSGAISEEEAKERARSAIGSIRYNDNEYLWVWTSNLISVVHANKNLVGKSGADIQDSNGVHVIREAVRGGLATPPQYVHYGWPRSDAPQGPSYEKIGYSVYFQPWDWVIGTGVFTDDLHSAFAKRMTTFGLFVAVIAIAAFFCGQLLARSISRPLESVKNVMLKLADENFDIEISGTHRLDEIGDLSRAALVCRDRGRQTAVLTAEKNAEQLARVARAGKIQELTKGFDGVVSEMLDSIAGELSELEVTAQAMTNNSAHTSRQATTVANTTEEATASVQTVASAAEELAASIREIASQVTRSSQVSQAASDHAGRTNLTVRSLVDSSARIGEVVRLINDIASQTNLLALNATIEAARAGEAGKGFAVVANEVKSLANQTSKATEEIGVQIGAVQTATQDAVSAIGDIVARITEINQIAASISSAVEEQSAATAEIARNIQVAANGTQQVSNTIDEVKAAALDTGTAAEQVLSSSHSVAQEAGHLKISVGTFLENIRNA